MLIFQYGGLFGIIETAPCHAGILCIFCRRNGICRDDSYGIFRTFVSRFYVAGKMGRSISGLRWSVERKRLILGMRFFFFSLLYFFGRLALRGVVTAFSVVGITLCLLIGISFFRLGDMRVGITCFIHGIKSCLSFTLLRMVSDSGDAIFLPVRREDVW